LNPGSGHDLASLAERFFGLLAASLPACCLSDEFPFLPRAGDARFHLSRTDRLEREHLQEVCGQVRALRSEVDARTGQDRGTVPGLLCQGMDAFLLHMDTLRVWEQDPALYLKAGWIGLDLALRLPGLEEEERADLLRARLRAVPTLLEWGERQLVRVAGAAREASLEMVAACRDSLARIVCGGETGPCGEGPAGGAGRSSPPATFPERGAPGRGPGQDLFREAARAREALDRFERFLRDVEGPAVWVTGPGLFPEVLRQGYGWSRGLTEAREILEAEAASVASDLRVLSGRIEAGSDWRDLYRRAGLPPLGYQDPVSLYREETGRLERFFRGLGVAPVPPPGSVRVEPTPDYLEPVRATASYSAPPCVEALSGGGRFYVTGIDPGPPGPGHVQRMDALHRDYRYLTAHETVPGHHLLDWVRLGLDDPVRRQTESALYYEGWACYAEQLVDECGFGPDPIQRLIRSRRQLWRAVRGRVDAGLQAGTLTVEQAAGALEAVGSGRAQARRQARRIALTPGYQLCYTLGKHGFLDLRRRFVPPLTLQAFHETVLSAGEAPFPCLERECAARLAAGKID